MSYSYTLASASKNELENHDARRLKYNTLYPAVLNRYKKKTYVETGLWLGHGIRVALDCGFESIYSCDINSKSVDLGTQMYGNNDNVKMYHAKSVDYLKMLFQSNNITENITFYLDAHFVTEEEALELGGEFKSPLLEEIQLIGKYCKDKDNVIMIDDYHKIEKWSHQKSELEKNLLKINKDFKLTIQPRIVEEVAAWNTHINEALLKTSGEILVAKLS